MSPVEPAVGISPVRLIFSCVSIVLFGLWVLASGANAAICTLATVNLCFFLFVIVVEKDILAPPYFLFLNVFIGIFDIVLVAIGGRDVPSRHESAIYEETLSITFLWLVMFYIGYALVKPKMQKVNRGGDSSDFVFAPLIALLLVLFLYSLISALRNSINLGGLVQGMIGGGAAFEDQGYLMPLLSLCGMLPVIALSKGKKALSVLLAAVLFFGIALTGRRSLAIFSALMPLIVFWHYRIKPLNQKTIVLIGVFLLAFVLIVGGIRTSVEQSATSDGMIATLTKYIGYGRNTPDLVSAIESGGIGYQGFTYSLRGIIYFIPRSIWPDKPLVHSSDITSNLLYFNGDVGRPTGPFGWAFFCFGIPGVAVFAFLTGVFCKVFYCYCIKKRDVFSLSMYALLIMSFLDIFTPEAQMKIVLFALFTMFVKVCIRRRSLSGFAGLDPCELASIPLEAIPPKRTKARKYGA